MGERRERPIVCRSDQREGALRVARVAPPRNGLGRTLLRYGWVGGLVVIGWVATSWGTQREPARRYVRAKPPAAASDAIGDVFFPDVFQQLVGERPAASGTSGVARPQAVASSGESTQSGSPPRVAGWAALISAATLEDEVKALKLSVDQSVTTPTHFAGRGHRVARSDFTLLAVLFHVIDQYEGEVRWKENAAAASQRFARLASLLKAGGSVQVYNQARQRQQDLDDLVRGARWPADERPAEPVEPLFERGPLMQVLENRMESRLKMWTTDAADFRRHREALRHDAELAAVIGRVLVAPGMDDADDDEYQGFARLLEQGASGVARAAASDDQAAALQALPLVSRSCSECHEWYR